MSYDPWLFTKYKKKVMLQAKNILYIMFRINSAETGVLELRPERRR
jgi:hypothetical protein